MMLFNYPVVNIFIATALWIDIVYGGDLCYKLDFSDNPGDCEGFENDKLIPTGMKMSQMEGKGGETFVALSGPLIFKIDITDSMEIKLTASQQTEVGSEPVMTVISKICESLSEEDAPWWPVVQALNASSCPIKAGDYPIKNLILSLDFADGVLCHQYVGFYGIIIEIIEKTETLACFTLGASISEYDCPEEE